MRPDLTIFRATALAIALLSAAPSARSAAPLPHGLLRQSHFAIGHTSPSRTALVSATQRGRIGAIQARPGAFVRAGDPLIRLDDQAQRIRTAIADARARSQLEVEQARIRMDKAQREHDRVVSLRTRQLASQKEVADTRTEADVARIEWETARFRHTQDQLNQQLQQQLLAEHHTVAPFDGFIAERLKDVGEAVDAHEGILRLVQLDPLEVAVDCPLALANQLRINDTFVVTPMDADWSPRIGRIVFINHVVHADSRLFRVRLLVDNPRLDWLAGIRVRVTVPSDPQHTRPGKPVACHDRFLGATQAVASSPDTDATEVPPESTRTKKPG